MGNSRGTAFQAFWVSIFTALVFLAAIIMLTAIGAGTPETARKPGGDRRPVDTERSAATVDSPQGIPVLCYHYLRPSTTALQFMKILGALVLNLPVLNDVEMWTQTTAAFETQMQYLHSEGYKTVSLDDVVEWRMGRKKLPERSVVITFDDGDRTVFEMAYPVLKRYGFRATLFVVTGHIGEEWQGVQNLDWEELWSLQMNGDFSIQSHTHDMHYKVKTGKRALPVFQAASRGLHDIEHERPWRDSVLRDLRRSRDLIGRHLGAEPRYLSWPYGFGDESLDSLAVAAGFKGICTLRPGHNYPLDDSNRVSRGQTPGGTGGFPFPTSAVAAPRSAGDSYWRQFEIRRYGITSRTTMRVFKKMLAGEIKE